MEGVSWAQQTMVAASTAVTARIEIIGLMEIVSAGAAGSLKVRSGGVLGE